MVGGLRYPTALMYIHTSQSKLQAIDTNAQHPHRRIHIVQNFQDLVFVAIVRQGNYFDFLDLNYRRFLYDIAQLTESL